jgi:phosphatidylserine/phosphatidylglycerophosphate/cardiolipin synthase-like enzyme
MSDALAEALAPLSAATLRRLADRLPAHLEPAALGALRLEGCGLPGAVARATAAALCGPSAPACAAELRRTLGLLAFERARLERERARATLAWTGSGGARGDELRDARRVMEDILCSADQSLLLSTYSWHLDAPAFATLFARARERPGLAVTLLLEPGEKRRKLADPDAIAAQLWQDVIAAWPSDLRPPRVFAPRTSLAPYQPGGDGVHHAKFVVADARRLLVTSANLTFAGAGANVELGVLLDCPRSAAALLREVEEAVRVGFFRRVVGEVSGT